MYVKTTTPDEKYALEEPDEPDVDYPPELSPAHRHSYFSPIAIFKLEEILEDMNLKELERAEAEKERQKREEERVINRTVLERARERAEKAREEAERKRVKESRKWNSCSDQP
jgi:hypothetical protein